MRYVVIILTAILTAFCFIKAQAQGNCVSVFGTNKDTCWSKTAGYLWLPVYADGDSTGNVAAFDVDGKVYKRSIPTPDLSGYLQKTDTSRSGIVATYYYVDSLYSTIGTHDSLVKYSDSNTVYATQYGTDTAKANLRTSIDGKVNYSDSAGFLPTKTFLANNYFANGCNTFGATATLGTNGSNALDFETNNTVRGRIGSTGNWMVGTTTDAGYKLDVNGTGRFSGILTVSGGLSVLTGGTAANILNGTSNTLSANNNTISGRLELSSSANQFTMLDITATPVTNAGYTLQYFRANNYVRNAAGSLNDYIVRIQPTYNYSAGTHTATGLYYNPTLTNVSGLANHRALHLVTGDVLLCQTSGLVGIGIAPSEKLHVEGNIKTAQPTASGAGAFKIGKILTGTDTNKYLEVEIDGVDYYIRALTALP